ncbi:MAG: VOC family protein [Gammaproteobacteria bacterium]|nr:VOC family protein [Gammaproteobacteria bacterium]
MSASILSKPTDRTVFQNAWVVDDVEAACMKWVNEMGVGPFYVTEYTDAFTGMTYRGQPSELDMFVAIAQAGPVQIEIIQPKTARCAYRDSVPAGTSGFHHICVWTHDIEADTDYFARLGYETANRGQAGDIVFAYYDTRPLMNCMLEVVTQSDSIVERFAMIAAAAENWDGKDPIRS